MLLQYILACHSSGWNECLTFWGAYLFLILLPRLEHFLVGKTDSVHSLERIIFRIPQPVGRRVTGGRKGLDFSGMAHVRTATQIDQISTPVDRGA